MRASVPPEIPGYGQVRPFAGAYTGVKGTQLPDSGGGRLARAKLLPDIRAAIEACGLQSGATVSFSGLGLSELYLNGNKIENHELTPAFAQYNQRAFYVTYDVTRSLRSGANALGVILGNGRYYADRSKVYAGTAQFGFPKLLLNLRRGKAPPTRFPELSA